jgi:DnaK suppressor protein
MDESRAQALLTAERAEVVASLNGIKATEAASEPDADIPGDMADAAAPLVAEAESDSIAGDLQERLAAIDRALARLAAGTYGRSVLSGQPTTRGRPGSRGHHRRGPRTALAGP